MRKLLTAMAFAMVAGLAQAGAYDEIIGAANNGDTTAVIDLLKRGMDVNTAEPADTVIVPKLPAVLNWELLIPIAPGPPETLTFTGPMLVRLSARNDEPAIPTPLRTSFVAVMELMC